MIRFHRWSVSLLVNIVESGLIKQKDEALQEPFPGYKYESFFFRHGILRDPFLKICTTLPTEMFWQTRRSYLGRFHTFHTFHQFSHTSSYQSLVIITRKGLSTILYTAQNESFIFRHFSKYKLVKKVLTCLSVMNRREVKIGSDWSDKIDKFDWHSKLCFCFSIYFCRNHHLYFCSICFILFHFFSPLIFF